ncbi:hypothetical protein Ocin01_17987 [Orchesella cincta]|uniref:Uncharacterized protein n=1 Tax=Orchesella cincta TaxID=48709 RepID=A0A1D2M6V3_ORCCI|nr:hypothetical protein Ocin01_17987 [Orchesella cincta]
MKSKLIHFWEQDLLPELADSRLERKLKPRLPEYRQLAIKGKEERLGQKHLHGGSRNPGASGNGVCAGADTPTEEKEVGGRNRAGKISRDARENPRRRRRPSRGRPTAIHGTTRRCDVVYLADFLRSWLHCYSMKRSLMTRCRDHHVAYQSKPRRRL